MSDTSASAVQVSIKADVSGLLSGLREASGATGDSAARMREDLLAIGDSAEEAGGHLGNFTEHLLEHASVMRREQRLGAFLARDIASMGLASKGAAGEITGLVGAFAFGGGLGVGLELVQMLVKSFTEATAEEAKAKEELQKFALAAQDDVKSLRDEVDHLVASIEGVSKAELMWHDKVAPSYREQFDAKQALIKANQELAETNERIGYGGETASPQEIEAAEEKVKQAQERLNIINEAIEAKKEQVERAAGATEAEETRKDAEDAEKEEAAHNARMMALKAALLDGEAKLRAECAIKVASIRANEKSTEEQDDAEIAAQRAVLDKQIADLRQKNRDADLKAHQKYLDDLNKAEYEANKSVEKLLADQEKYREDRQKHIEKMEDDEAKAQQQRANELAHNIDRFAKQAVSDLVSIVDGTKSVGQAMAELSRQLATDVLDALVKIGAQQLANAVIGVSTATTVAAANKVAATSSAEASIAVSAMEAATAVAWLGPEAAAGAAAATAAALEGIAVPLLSASGGFDVPSTMNPVTQLHAREMVLPAQYADVIRGLASGDGAPGAGGDVHVHIHGAIDGASVQRFVESAAFRTAMREARRNGLAP